MPLPTYDLMPAVPALPTYDLLPGAGALPIFDLLPDTTALPTRDLPPAVPAPDTEVVRREERFTTSWLVNVALPDGTTLPCTAKDVSKSGARLAIPAGIGLPDVLVFNVIGKPLIVQARVAWRRGDYVGVTVERTARLPEQAAVRRRDASNPVPTVRRATARSGANHLSTRR